MSAVEGNGRGSASTAAISPLTEIPISVAGRSAAVPAAVPRTGRAQQRARRVLNVAAAFLLLLLAAPLMLLIALAVWLSSPGPILYRQTRVGLDRRTAHGLSHNWRRKYDYGGKLFTIYKFRTMYVGADRIGEVWAAPDDPRITPVGRFLRRYRLDELPQLFNVLRGDMNLVGPRPEQPKIFASLRDQIDRYHTRQSVLPGITGWAQVNQHYDVSIDDVRRKVMFDLEYIHRCSIAEDLRIIARTVPVVLGKKGAW